MTTESECSKCGGATVRGFIFDRGHHDYKSRQTWVEGAPEQSFWSGIKTSDRNAFSVDSYRCVNCGRLEFYTAESVDLNSIFS